MGRRGAAGVGSAVVEDDTALVVAAWTIPAPPSVATRVAGPARGHEPRLVSSRPLAAPTCRQPAVACATLWRRADSGRTSCTQLDACGEERVSRRSAALQELGGRPDHASDATRRFGPTNAAGPRVAALPVPAAQAGVHNLAEVGERRSAHRAHSSTRALRGASLDAALLSRTSPAAPATRAMPHAASDPPTPPAHAELLGLACPS